MNLERALLGLAQLILGIAMLYWFLMMVRDLIPNT